MRDAHSGPHKTESSGWPIALDLLLGLGAAFALALLLQAWLATSSAWVIVAVTTYVALAAIVYGFWTAARSGTGRPGDFGWANRVTLARAVMVAVLAGVLAVPEIIQRHGIVLALLALAAIALDGLDGWLARMVDDATRFGARFDMEIDALLILVLSIAVLLADRAGAWVLAIGGMRYAFVLAGQLLPWLQAELPPSTWRKIVCVTQGIVLAVAFVPWLPLVLVQSALSLSLAALVHSFGRDTVWLWQHRAADSA